MQMHGCSIDCKPSNFPETVENEKLVSDGFASTVHRGRQKRGPFKLIKHAHECARKWDSERKEFAERVPKIGVLQHKIESALSKTV